MAAADFIWQAPHPEDELGLVAMDRTLTPERVISAYRHGIFPWPESPRLPIPWVCPARRAVLDFADLHIPKNLRKSRRRLSELRFTADQAFPDVIEACAKSARPGQRGTWITPAMQATYVEVHRRGQAHSIEAWLGTDLVAGLYGVTAAGVFTGESMFHRIDDGSKLCVLHLIERLSARGSTWMDIQQLTPHFEVLGAREIPRDEFLERLSRERPAQRVLFP